MAGPVKGAGRITRLALLTAIALTIFMVEAQIPALTTIPGVKLGLANVVTVYAMFAMGPRDALLVLSGRVFLGAVFSGCAGPAAKAAYRRADLAGQPCGSRLSQFGPASRRRRRYAQLGGDGLPPLSGHCRRPCRTVYRHFCAGAAGTAEPDTKIADRLKKRSAVFALEPGGRKGAGDGIGNCGSRS